MNSRGPTLLIAANPLWTGDCARLVDRLSIESYGIPQHQLMDRAGKAVAAEATRHGKNFLVLAGPGNNGGDALVAAHELSRNAGIKVHIIKVPKHDPDFIPSLPEHFDCVIDGVLGLGFKDSLAPESPAAKVLVATAEKVRSLRTSAPHHQVTVVAIDQPSALDCDDGRAENAYLPADCTVTFGGIKAVHALAPARDLCGTTICTEPGFSQEAIREAFRQHPPMHAVVERDLLLALNPWHRLPPGAHKYDRGHVLVIGGSAGKTGAPVLSAMAALRTGAGWATVSIPAQAGTQTFMPPDLTSENLWIKGKHGETIDPRKLEKFLGSRKVKAVVVGPGTMTNPLTVKSLAVLGDFSTQGCVVLDAGALQGIEQMLASVSCPPTDARMILTPHPGEWRRLGEGGHRGDHWPEPLTPGGVSRLRELCGRFGIHVLYKHATPILCGPENFALEAPDTPGLAAGSLVFNQGTNAMGRAGTGDVLAGCIAAHGAIDCPAGFAAMRALCLVARATALAGEKVGYHAVLPTDIIRELGRAG